MVTLETIIALALQEQVVMDQLGEALRSDLVVANPFYRQIVTFADDFAVQYNRLPQAGDYEVWLSGLTEQMREGVRECLGRLWSQNTEAYHPAYFAEQVLGELKAAATKTAVARLNAAPTVTPEILKGLTDKVDALSVGGVTGLADLRDIDTWVMPHREEELLPTGIGPLDDVIGGWGRELVIVFADSGVGKSMLLQNFGASAAQKGKNVLHITLELGLRPLIQRYYRQIARAPRSQFVQELDVVKSRLTHWFRFARGQIHLLELPAYSTDPETLGRLISRVERTVTRPEVIIIDYLDLLVPPPGFRGQTHEALGRITHMIRAYCSRFDAPVLTATQAVRKPGNAKRLSMQDVSNSYEKVRGADMLLALNQTPEEEEVMQGRLGILKVRDSAGRGQEVPLYINRELAIIADLHHPNTQRLMRDLGHIPGTPPLAATSIGS